MRRLTEQGNVLRSQLAEQSTTLMNQHPRIKELRAQIAEIERAKRAEGERLARQLENDAKVAGDRLQTLTASLDQVKKLASQTNEQDVELRALERDAKSQRELLESYLVKYSEASARDNINAAPPEARIISRASPAIKPSYPKKAATVLIAAFAAFVLSARFHGHGCAAGAAAGPGRLWLQLCPGVRAGLSPCRLVSPPPAYAAWRRRMPQAPPYMASPPLMPVMPAAMAASHGTAGDRTFAGQHHRATGAEPAASWAMPAAGSPIAGSQRNAGHDLCRDHAGAGAGEDTPMWCWWICAFGAPNVSVISTDPECARSWPNWCGAGRVVRRCDYARPVSNVHLVATGNVGTTARRWPARRCWRP